MMLKLIKTTVPLNPPRGPFTSRVREDEEYHWWENLLIWIHQKSNLCSYCGWRMATWMYMPNWYQACDECVPRGCACNQEEDGTENTDAHGRKLPCCEWWNG